MSILATVLFISICNIQPIDIDSDTFRTDTAAKPVLKSRLRRLFDRQFHCVLKISSSEKLLAAGYFNKDVGGGGGGEIAAVSDFEPSSVCLATMVQIFIEESNDKRPLVKCGRNRCNCFHGNNNESSEDELDFFGADSTNSAGGVGSFGGSASEILKSLIPCVSVAERNLLADVAKIVAVEKNPKPKDELRKIVADGLVSVGYNSSLCKSKWDKSPSFPAGEYEYIDVIAEGERLLIDIDFRSEFEVARSTGAYKSILQSLPFIFVGKSDRLNQIISIVSEAARQSLKKKGMPFPPWRKADYVRAKWLSRSQTRAKNDVVSDDRNDHLSHSGEFELIFGVDNSAANSADISPEMEAKVTGNSTWQPPAVKPKSVERGGARIVTGLASLLAAKP